MNREVTTNNTHTNKKTSLRQLRWGDILLFLLISAIACYVRFVLRNIVAGDYKMFFEPWVAILRQAGGGIKGLAAEFEYVDYTTPYLTILSFISICPFLNTLLLMKIVSILFEYYPSGTVEYKEADGKPLDLQPSDCRSLEPVLIRALE
ncbi:MAG: hypothetical protein IJ930_10300, partial [Lachnospiraceae bacterium]|nr:hypothetical protein [Lachnospiraceae bacterium]